MPPSARQLAHMSYNTGFCEYQPAGNSLDSEYLCSTTRYLRREGTMVCMGQSWFSCLCNLLPQGSSAYHIRIFGSGLFDIINWAVDIIWRNQIFLQLLLAKLVHPKGISYLDYLRLTWVDYSIEKILNVRLKATESHTDITICISKETPNNWVSIIKTT